MESHPVSGEQAVTQWIRGLREGEQQAAARLWQTYYARLAGVIRRKLPDHVRRAFDEEDVALSAFQSFCSGVGAGRFPRLDDTDNLWSLLLVIARRKVQEYLRNHRRLKRGGGQVRGESGVIPVGNDEAAGGFDLFADDDPPPEVAAEFAEQVEALLDRLGSDELRAIALLRMQGYQLAEVAERMGCTRRMIERRLDIIRRTWSAPDAEGGA